MTEHFRESATPTGIGYVIGDCSCGTTYVVPEGGDEYAALEAAQRAHEASAPAPAVTRDELAKLVETTLRGLSLRIGPNASDLLVAGKWQTLPLTGAECREIAAVVAEGLDECVDIRLRPTEGSDTDHA